MAFRAGDNKPFKLNYCQYVLLNPTRPKPKLALFLSLFLSFWLLLIVSRFPPPSTTPPSRTPTNLFIRGLRTRHHHSAPAQIITCPPHTARFYIYDLPPKFNDHLLRHCRTLNIYTDMCPHLANRGLGRPVPPLLPPVSTTPTTTTTSATSSWYATHQFIAEMIFHARAENHPCRTRDQADAELFYVPFYAGLYASSVFAELSLPERDRLGEELADFLESSAPWSARRGDDHFLAVGRTAWDFMRDDGATAAADFGANRLFLLPAVRNMTVLTVERQPWTGGKNQVGIPYASYFHPSSSGEVAAWQEFVRSSRRTHLFAFVGGPRKGVEKAAAREEILRQCGESRRCLQSECAPGSSLCHEPSRVIGVMLRAAFCMQPPGDSFTRRSVFDSVLAGCIPVFFSEHTAQTQYGWYLPGEGGEYSVFVPESKWGRLEEELMGVPEAEVERMRERVIGLIPSLTYAHPDSSDPGFSDAVDVALSRLTQRVRENVQN